MAFVMRDEWKEEPVSTTGAAYVEPSATELIKPGQRVSHLFPRAVMEEFVLQRVTERVWWVTRQFYGSLFYVGERGVLLFDPFLGGIVQDDQCSSDAITTDRAGRHGDEPPGVFAVAERHAGGARNPVMDNHQSRVVVDRHHVAVLGSQRRGLGQGRPHQ